MYTSIVYIFPTLMQTVIQTVYALHTIVLCTLYYIHICIRITYSIHVFNTVCVFYT